MGPSKQQRAVAIRKKRTLLFTRHSLKSLSVDLISARGEYRGHDLKEFVNSLSIKELVRLESIIDERVERSVTSLPEEVVVQVSAYLDLPDIIACQHVCRAWRAIWTAQYVSENIVQVHYPDLATYSGAQYATRLRNSLIVSSTWLRNRYLSTMSVELTPRGQRAPFQLDAVSPSDLVRSGAFYDAWNRDMHASVVYHDKRVAWSCGKDACFVDNLQELTRTLVSPPGTKKLLDEGTLGNLEVVAMSNKLLVMMTSFKPQVVYVAVALFLQGTPCSYSDQC